MQNNYPENIDDDLDLILRKKRTDYPVPGDDYAKSIVLPETAGNVAFVYDFDETLVYTSHLVYKYNLWGQLGVFSEDPDSDDHLGLKIVRMNKPIEHMWGLVSESYELGTNYILSGRNEKQIECWLKLHNRSHLFKDVIGLAVPQHQNPKYKSQKLIELAEQYDQIVSIDDNVPVIEAVGKIDKVVTVLVK